MRTPDPHDTHDPNLHATDDGRRNFIRSSLGLVGAALIAATLPDLSGCKSSSNPVTTPSELRLDTSTSAYAPLAAAGSWMSVDSGSVKLDVFRLSATEVSALSRICTHEGCDMAPSGNGSLSNGKLMCGCHGSSFDIRTGAVTHGPAFSALRSYTARIDGAVIIITIS